MNSAERRNNVQPEGRRLLQMHMGNFIRHNTVTNNEQHVDEIKLSTCMRFVTLNVKDLDPKSIEKMDRFIASMKKCQVDVMLLNKVNAK